MKISNSRLFPYKMGQNTCKIFNNFKKLLSGVTTHDTIMVIRVIRKQQDFGLLLSVKLLETGGIYNSSYWKIAGLAACHFQGNSWKLGASIIRVIGKQQAQRLAIFRGTLETGVSIIWGIGKQQTPGNFNDQLLINLKL